MKYLIAGLGNPGLEYTRTRHNIGFLVLDRLAELYGITFQKSNFGEIGIGRIKNKQIILLKPDTYMNLSGNAIKFWKNKEKLELDNILVITDDLALPFGKIRIRTKGSDGGHNGLKSIQEQLASQSYSRIRFGIGKEFKPGEQVDYVLGNWQGEELLTLEEKINLSCEAVKMFALEGASNAMTKFNGI